MFDFFDRNGLLMDPHTYQMLHPFWAFFWGLVAVPFIILFWIYPIKLLQAGIIYCVVRFMVWITGGKWDK